MVLNDSFYFISISFSDGFQPPERPVNKPLRMCIYDVFKGMTGGFCLAGKIDSGFIRTGDKVIIMPAGEQGSVKSTYYITLFLEVEH